MEVMDNPTKDKVFKILSRITGNNIHFIDLESDLKTQLSLDSIQIVELFASLEKELNIELPLKLMTVKTGKAFLEVLEEQLRQ